MKILKYVITSFLVLTCFAACSNKPIEEAFTRPQYDWGTTTNRTVTVWGEEDEIDKNYFREVCELYEKLTGNSVQLRALTNEEMENGTVESAFSEPSSARPDLLLWHGGTSLTALSPENNFVDFTDAVWVKNKDVTDSALNQAVYNGKIMGLPYGEAAISGTLYNKNIFKKYGLEVPTTRKEFQLVCKALLSVGITPMYLPYADNAMMFYELPMNTFLSHGTVESLNKRELSYAEIPEMKLVAEWYRKMSDDGFFGQNYTQNNWAGMSDALESGEYAMALCWDTWLYTDYQGNPADFGLMPAFVGTPENGCFEGANLLLALANKNSSELATAEDFITYLSDPYIYNQVYAKIYSYPVFNNQIGNTFTPQYLDAESVVNRLFYTSTARLRVEGFSQSDAKFIQKFMRGQGTYTVDDCLREMDDSRIDRVSAHSRRVCQ